jgi:2-oxoacid:acceptor oxidoreductase delta subunit (pyruvate/2-ketoisovalerate family)
MIKPGKKVNLTCASELPPSPASLGSMSQNYTGSWRNVKPEVDQSQCIHCGICWKFCPDAAISIENNQFAINYYFCKGCGICAAECPKKCITLVEEGR